MNYILDRQQIISVLNLIGQVMKSLNEFTKLNIKNIYRLFIKEIFSLYKPIYQAYVIMNINQQNPKQTLESVPNNSQDQQSESSSEYSSINQQELNYVCRTVAKLKKIEKKGQLGVFKQKFKNGNQLFAQMSSFFHQKKRMREDHKKKSKEEKMKLRQKQARKTIKYNSKQLYQGLNQLNKQGEQYKESQFEKRQNQILEIQCHVCKALFYQSHHFYTNLCPSCAQLNWTKRTQSADLKHITALITGGRIKIGFQAALKLLRDGAVVYLTSRFPKDCLLRYQKQCDYENWKCRLHIIQCDFLSEVQVNYLINYIKVNVGKLDILINNAAQTIVRPKQFYSKQLENQKLALEFPNVTANNQIQKANAVDFKQIYSSVYANQITIKDGQIDLVSLDQFGQPLDKRKTNTWVQKIQDVSLLDCYTTQIVNSIVPFHLISQLKEKMIGNSPSWVINVSSMQGVFYRPGKQQFHPHTNMAKAALNMITRTCAQDFRLSNIYMNSVDTGWITNENPYEMAQQMSKRHGFICPLDCIDGAMRILDPIYLGIIHQQFPFGQFLKNYQSSYW